jgi:HD superfamily phosphohydrolase
MHLASRFVISALENAAEDDAKAFLEGLRTEVGLGITLKTKDLLALLKSDPSKGTGGLQTGKGTFKNPVLRKDNYTALLGLAEAAVRLAALFHDLGHLPYSHDFEYALKSFAKAPRSASEDHQYKLTKLTSGTPHEILGHRLADLVFQGLADASKPAGVRAAFKLAKDILNEEPNYDFPKPQIGILGWLHSLVDGQVDVDRADYLLRDARALGFEFAGYNLDQLVDNLVLVRHQDLGFVTAIDEKGLVALESFCLSRARSNQVLTRHHKSAQIGAAFRFASVAALSTTRAGSFLNELNSILNEFSDGAKARDLLEVFSRHDDPWWLEVLREAKRDEDEDLLGASRAVILDRQPRLRSVWKRKGDLTDKERKKINDLAASGTEDLEAFERVMKTLRDKKNILIAVHRFTPYTKAADGTSVLLVRTRDGLRPASEMSSLIRSLDAAWAADVHMHAFTNEVKEISASEVIGAIKRALTAAKRASKPKRSKASAGRAEKITLSRKRKRSR